MPYGTDCHSKDGDRSNQPGWSWLDQLGSHLIQGHKENEYYDATHRLWRHRHLQHRVSHGVCFRSLECAQSLITRMVHVVALALPAAETLSSALSMMAADYNYERIC